MHTRIQITPRHMAMLSIAAACITLGLKFLAYHLTGSVSLYSDALESFVNLAAAIAGLVALSIAAKPADREHPWGHEKAEYFSSGFEGALIIIAAISIVYESLHKLMHPTPMESIGWGIVISMLATAVNAGTAIALLRYAKRHDSITLEADAHHLLSDVWTSLGVAIALGLLMLLPPSWAFLDPLIAILVAINILRIGTHLLRRSADGLMDSALPDTELTQIESAIQQALPNNARHHALRTRKSGNKRFVEFKLNVPGNMTVAKSHALCDQLEAHIQQQLARCQVTIHVEPAD
ncbi:cation diffusion facilitator family transporter [Chitinimonas sp. BJB300]|uniref:cation diffusion facilitator family transporter n=1 Tax=Chitinimonas sp. BJB300 TaxID=1559339 RepID=UPI0018EE4484|nr:cation diffusion facilitator family transporter [Chitinimonas sp. BJB300]